MLNGGCGFFLIGTCVSYFYHRQALFYGCFKQDWILTRKLSFIVGIFFSISYLLKPSEPIELLLLLTLLSSTSFIDYYTYTVFKRPIYIYGMLLFLLNINRVSSCLVIGLFFVLFNYGYKWRYGITPIGYGDIDLLIIIGLILDIQAVCISVLLAALLAGSVGYVRKIKKLPFVPFLAIGCWITYIYL